MNTVSRIPADAPAVNPGTLQPSEGMVDEVAVVEDSGNLTFTYSSESNSWTTGVVELTGDCWLRVVLPGKGRLAIRHLYKGQWPIVLMSPYTGPDFEIRIYGKTMGGQIIIETTRKPISGELDAI